MVCLVAWRVGVTSYISNTRTAKYTNLKPRRCCTQYLLALAIFNAPVGVGATAIRKLRPIAAVVDDVRNEMISIERAKTDYGVVVDAVSLEVNERETATLRAKTESS